MRTPTTLLFTILATPVLQAAEPQGYYLLQAVDRPNVSDRELEQAHIRGLSIRFSWRQTNPEPDVYDWQFVDQQISRARRLGKDIMVRSMAGVVAPEWLYELGAEGTTSRKGYRMPVPWDESMLRYWSRYVAEFGRKYGQGKDITLVHMSGPTADSVEMHLPDTLAPTRENIERVFRAWKTSIDAYDAAFPETPIALNLGIPLNGRDGLPERVSKYLIDAVGQRATLQSNALSARTSDRFGIYRLIRSQSRQGVRVGFQMLGNSGHPRFGGTFQRAIRTGEEAGAKYYEIYRLDVHKAGR